MASSALQRLRTASLALALLAPSGCGRSRSTAPDAGEPDSGSAGAAPTTALAEGSFDVHFAELRAESEGAPAPSEVPSFRIDLLRETSGLSAIVTPRWGDPEPFAVRDKGNELAITGTVVVGESPDGGQPGKRWSTFTVPLDTEGRIVLGEGVGGFGLEAALVGDELWSFGVRGSGTIEIDATKPELRHEFGSPYGPLDALLPWDVVLVRAAEPLAWSTFQGPLVLTSSEFTGEEIDVTWGGSPVEEARAKAGLIELRATPKAWKGLMSGGELLVQAAPAEAIVDWRGNALADAIIARVPLLSFGVEAPAHFFASEAEVATWGPHRFLRDADAQTLCSGQTTCVEVGPLGVGGCGERAGIGGLLSVSETAGTSYTISYVARAAEPNPSNPFFRVLTAAPDEGGALRTFPSPTFTDLGPSAGELRYVSEPSTWEVDYPLGFTPPGVVAFVIALGEGACEVGGEPVGMSLIVTGVRD